MNKYLVRIENNRLDTATTIILKSNNVHDILYYVYGLEMPDNEMWVDVVVKVYREINSDWQLITTVKDWSE